MKQPPPQPSLVLGVPVPKIICATVPNANRQAESAGNFSDAVCRPTATQLFDRKVVRISNLRTVDDLRTLRVEIFRFAVNLGTTRQSASKAAKISMPSCQSNPPTPKFGSGSRCQQRKPVTFQNFARCNSHRSEFRSRN